MKDILYGAIGIISALAIFAGGVVLGAGMFPPGYQKEGTEETTVTDTETAAPAQETTSSAAEPVVTEPVIQPAAQQTQIVPAVQVQSADALKDKITVDMASYPRGDGRDVIFLLTNDNPEAVRVELNITARDTDGKAFAAESEVIRLLPAKESLPRVVFFDKADVDTVYDYTFVVSEPDLEDATDDLKAEATAADGKVIVEYTNEGDRNMTHCAVYCTFYNEGVPVYVDYAFVGTGLGEIEPGATFSQEVSADGHAFDSFSWYAVAGYRSE